MMKIPSLLYKYRSLSTESSRQYTKSILVDGELYLASIKNLNDPFEGRFTVSFGEKPENLLTEKELYIREAFAYHLRESEQIGVLSLTAKSDNILMWSHYADNHRGICIGFNTTAPSQFFQNARPVVYQSDFPSLIAGNKAITPEILALRKYSQWEYEQEWRMIEPEPGVRKIPKEHISSIILGSSISSDDRKLIQEWILVAEYEQKIAVYQASVNNKSYTLEVRPIAA